jgi:predicted CopG family antitoxin
MAKKIKEPISDLINRVVEKDRKDRENGVLSRYTGIRRIVETIVKCESKSKGEGQILMF